MFPTHIIVHTSDSPYGSVELIREWHLARGWKDIGYHYVVTNGHKRTSRGDAKVYENGMIRHGREENATGAHARGYNARSIGVCLIGKRGNHSAEQLAALYGLILGLMFRYGIPVENVIGHYETDSGSRKTCPDIEMRSFRAKLDRIYTKFNEEMACMPIEEDL